MDSVWRSDLDAGASQPDVMSFGVAGGDLTYYVFAGPTPAAVLARYADLTGHIPLPPRWALGYGQSRWSYFPESQVRYIAEEYRKRRIPCDSLWLDIDYTDGYRVYTWNERRFPDPAQLARDLAGMGFKLVTIIDPGVKADPAPTQPNQDWAAKDYFVRREMLRPSLARPGRREYPPRTPSAARRKARRWWGARHRELLEAAIVAHLVDTTNEPTLPTGLRWRGTIPPARRCREPALYLPGWPERQAAAPRGVPQRLRHADGARDV